MYRILSNDFKFNFCAYNLLCIVQKFSGIVVMVVETDMQQIIKQTSEGRDLK
jgi:hypothetical protein